MEVWGFRFFLNHSLFSGKINQKECGYTTLHCPTIKLTNGKKATHGCWSWHAGIAYRTGRDIRYSCGGSLITERSTIDYLNKLEIYSILMNKICTWA